MGKKEITKSVRLTRHQAAILQQKMAEIGVSSFTDFVCQSIGVSTDFSVEIKDPERTQYGREKRNIDIHCKVTASEMTTIETLMRNAGYRSISVFIRDCILKKRLVIHKSSSTTAEAILRDEISRLTAQISRIGNNYNQIVVKVNSLSKMTKKNGDPVIGPKTAFFYLKQLTSKTQLLRKELEIIIKVVKKYIEYTENINHRRL